MKIMSLNVQSWDVTNDRMEALIKCLKTYKPDLIGFQEITYKWDDALTPEFKDEYEIIGEWRFYNREYGFFDNEKNSIYIKKSKYEVLEYNTCWLSSTPDKETICEECVFPRVYTYAFIRDKETGKKFVFVNTHLDYLCEQGRNNEMIYLIKFLNSLPKDMPIIMTGDFNSTSDEQAYKSLSKVIIDSKTLISPIDNTPTWFVYKDKEIGRRSLIDYVFINKLVSIHSYKVATEEYNNRWVSDHYPVVAELELK